MAVSISICNLALGDLRAPTIADIAEESVEARECARYYPHCLATMLDRYPWSFVTRLATLAKLGSNDRPLDWQYAYALPTNVLRPMRTLPQATVGLTYLLPTHLAGCWDRFEVVGNTLYSNLDAVQLEYAADDLDASAMPPLFRDALRKLLASTLAVPLRDSREMKGDFLKEAEIALQRAIADDMNRQPSGDCLDDVALARMG